MVQEHLLCNGTALPGREEVQHQVLLPCQMDWLTCNLRLFGLDFDRQVATKDRRFSMPLGAADDRVNAGDELVSVERLGEVVVRARTPVLSPSPQSHSCPTGSAPAF